MKRFNGFSIAALTIVIMAACFFLPDTVAGIQDTQAIGKLNIEDSNSISVETNPEMTLSERLTLISISNSLSVPVKNGKKLNIVTSFDRVVADLKSVFVEDGLGFDFDKVTVDLQETLLIIDADDPSINMLVWRFVLQSPSGETITLVMDDETGTILQLIYKFNQNSLIVSDKRPNLSAEFNEIGITLSQLLTDYYGVTVTLSEFELLGSLGFYKAELWESGLAIPMFGIIQNGSISINDRHSAN